MLSRNQKHFWKSKRNVNSLESLEVGDFLIGTINVLVNLKLGGSNFKSSKGFLEPFEGFIKLLRLHIPWAGLPYITILLEFTEVHKTCFPIFLSTGSRWRKVCFRNVWFSITKCLLCAGGFKKKKKSPESWALCRFIASLPIMSLFERATVSLVTALSVLFIFQFLYL